MVITKDDNINFSLILTSDEKLVFLNAINYIIMNLEDELSTRTGFYVGEYRSLETIINGDSRTYKLNKDEILMIHQALNEVCNGIVVPDFEKQIGLPASIVKDMLLKLSIYVS